MHIPDPDELEALSEKPARAVSPPTPEIRKRVDELRNPPKPLSDAVKLELLAHVLHERPIERTMSFYDGRVELVFRTISASKDSQLLRVCAGDQLKYRQLLALSSLVEGRFADTIVHGLRLPENFDLVLDGLNREQAQLIYAAYDDFRQELDRLISEAATPGFWPALS